MKKLATVPPHNHPEGGDLTLYEPHHEDHETGGGDAITAIAGEIITSGTIDGDRLPAISTTKKGAVPAVTAGATELLAKWLKDTGLFARIVQANCDGLKTTDTPQFAGLGVGVAGADNQINLKEAALIGPTAGPNIRFNLAALLLELLLGDVNIGDTPTQPGTGGAWSESYDSDRTAIMSLGTFEGALLAGSFGETDAKLFRLSGGSWAQVFTDATDYGFRDFAVHNRKFYACGGAGTARIYVSSDGASWALLSEVAANNGQTIHSHGGLLWLGVGMYQGQIHYSTDDGATWNLSLTPPASVYASNGLVSFNGDLYVASYESSGSKRTFIYKYDGASWSLVYTSANNVQVAFPNASYVWNGKLYFGCDGGRLIVTDDGVNFTLTADIAGSKTIYSFCEYNAKLIIGAGANLYETEDGSTWAGFSGSGDGGKYSLCIFGGHLYTGTSDSGKIRVYTDNTYVPAPSLTVFGHATVHGQFRPGDMAGTEGDVLLSGGADHASWLARGTTGQYIGGVTDGKPIYKTIPASDVSFSANSYTEAENVQDAIEEVQADCLTRAKVTIKTDTGDPASGESGEICVNAFDNTLKIYADGAWRQVATW